MNISIKSLIIPVLLIYLLLATKLSFTVSALLLAIVLFALFFRKFLKKAKMEYLSSNGIKSVPKNLVFNNNTLTNSYCIVRYFSNNKIVVIDNPLSKKRDILRAFVVDKTNHENVNNCWNDICSVYDEYTYLDSLFSFIDKSSGRLNIMFLNREEGKFTFEGMEEFLPKQIDKVNTPKEKISNEKITKRPEQNLKSGQIIVEFNDLQHRELKINSTEENVKNIVNMQDLTDSDKIDVNLADAETISKLPGINIAMAKKIVEIRNINGFFKNKEDFLNISNVKEHFKEQISKVITVEKSSAVIASKEFEAEKERTVD